MSDGDVLGVLTILLCLVGSFFFSGSETAITSFDAHRAQRLVEEGGKEGRALELWVKDPVRVLSTILIGNNLVNTLMGAVVTALALRHLEGTAWGSYAVGIAVFLTMRGMVESLVDTRGRYYAEYRADVQASI